MVMAAASAADRTADGSVGGGAVCAAHRYRAATGELTPHPPRVCHPHPGHQGWVVRPHPLGCAVPGCGLAVRCRPPSPPPLPLGLPFHSYDAIARDAIVCDAIVCDGVWRPPSAKTFMLGGGSGPPSSKTFMLGGGSGPPSAKTFMLGGGVK